MAHYLIEVGYTPQAWSAQIDKHPNVIDRISPAVAACGATIVNMYYAFGESDLVGIMDFPTPEDAAAFGLAVASSGALRSYKTTPLLTIDQGIAAMQRAEEIRRVYSPPVSISIPEPAASR